MQNRSKFPQILPQILPQRFWHPILISFENKQTQSKTKSKLWKQHICLFPIFFKRVSPIKDPSKTPEQKKQTNKQNLYVYNFPSHKEKTKKNYVCCIYRCFSCLTTYICFHDIQGFLHDVSYDFTLFFHDFQCFSNFLLHFFHNSPLQWMFHCFSLKKSCFSMIFPVDFWIFPLSRGLRLGGRHVRHAAAPDVAPGEQLGGRGALDALQITWLSMVKTYDKFTRWDYGIYIVYSL